MDFELSKEQKMLRDMVRSFVDKEIIPYIKEWDEKGEFNMNVLKRLGELDLMGVCIPRNMAVRGWITTRLPSFVRNLSAAIRLSALQSPSIPA